METKSQNISKSKVINHAIRRLFAVAEQRKGTRSGTGVTFKLNRKKFCDLVRDMSEEIKQEEKQTKDNFDQDNTLDNDFDNSFKWK